MQYQSIPPTACLQRTILASLAVLLLFPGAAAANDVVAEIENGGTVLIFHPVIEFNQLILTVTGPCNFLKRDVFKRGDTPFFKLNEETIDGMYRYSLVSIPEVDPGIIEVLKRAREIDDNSEVNQLCRDGKMPGDPATQSDGFLVANSKIQFEPGTSDGKGAGEGEIDFDTIPLKDGGDIPLKDFVILDDLIVDGSACIGFDCVNGESFGFDTIRLKENNLRIKFDDTSVAASYPRTDWQLTANASANGGASKFSIDDISGGRTPFTVEANARSHSLYVDDGGRLGNRTSTPSTEIHTIDGDTPTLRLQQDGSSGFVPQTWDVAGNETNFFIRDVTNGSTLPFRIRPGAPTSSLDISSSGNVGVGTTSPDKNVDIEDDGPEIRFTNTGATAGSWDWFVNGNNNRMNLTDDPTHARVPLKLAPNADNNLMRLGVTASNTVDIDGDLVVSGTITPDFVFEPDYALESIEDHAEYMWREKHLPAVGAAVPDGRGKHSINIGARSEGMLEELEKAHIYIEQLNNQLKTRDAEVAALSERLARLEELLLDAAQ